MGTLLIILAAICWGTTGTAQAFAPAGASSLAIGSLRLIVGAFGLWMVGTLQGDLQIDRRLPWRAVLVTGVATALYQLTFFAGVYLTGVAVGTLVTIGSSPIFAGVLGMLFQGERPSQSWYVATPLAVIGCVLLAIPGETVTTDALGIGLTLLAGLSYAVFALFNKHVLRTHSANTAMTLSIGLGALLLLPALAFVQVDWLWTLRGSAVILELGLVATALSYFLYGRGLKRVSVANATTLSLMEPLTATVLGVFVLHEQLTAFTLGGVALIALGLIVLVRADYSSSNSSM